MFFVGADDDVEVGRNVVKMFLPPIRYLGSVERQHVAASDAFINYQFQAEDVIGTDCPAGTDWDGRIHIQGLAIVSKKYITIR